MPASVPYRRTFVRLLGFLRPYKVVARRLGRARGRVAGRRGRDGVPHRRRDRYVVESRDRGELWLLVGAVLAVGLARALFMSGRRFISGRQALGVEYDLRDALYAQLLRLSFGFYDRHQTGQLMSRATVDVQAVRFFLGYGLIFFVQHVLTIVGVVGRAVRRRTGGWRWSRSRSRRSLVGARVPLQPRLAPGAARRPAAHGRRRDARPRRTSSASTSSRRSRRRSARRSASAARAESVFAPDDRRDRQRALYMPLLSFLPLARAGGACCCSAAAGRRRHAHARRVLRLQPLLVMLVMPLRMLGMWIGQAQRAIASGERIFEVLDEPSEDRATRPGAGRCRRGQGDVRFEDVAFGYDDGAAGAARTSTSTIAPGRDGRADRPHGLGQDDARLARAALLRRRAPAACSSTASTSAT